MIGELVAYLNKLEHEIIMRDYLDGWHITWLEKEIKDTKNKIKCLEE